MTLGTGPRPSLKFETTNLGQSKLFARRLKKLLSERDGLDALAKGDAVVKDSKLFYFNAARNLYAWDRG